MPTIQERFHLFSKAVSQLKLLEDYTSELNNIDQLSGKESLKECERILPFWNLKLNLGIEHQTDKLLSFCTTIHPPLMYYLRHRTSRFCSPIIRTFL
jgi:hypothetical protein